MVKGLESNFSESKRLAYNFNKPVEDKTLVDCSICLEPLVNENDPRTHVTLRCEHKFHLDCIGSAFNAKNKMECPNCRKVEQGQWLYASGIDGLFPEEGEVDPEFFLDSENHRMELCPFEGYVHLNSAQWATGHFWSDGRPHCHYHDYIVTIPLPSAATRVIDRSDFTNHLTTGLDEVVNHVDLLMDPLSHGSTPSDLIPLSPTPTNPRFFRSASEDVIIARYYLSHPQTGHSPINGFENSRANVAVVSALAANVPLTQVYPNGSSAVNGLVAPQEYNTISTRWVHSIEDDLRQNIGRNIARTADNEQCLLHNMLHGGGGRHSYGGRSNEEGGSSRCGRASGSGGGNSNNSGSD